jgi:hypothetical protein
LRVRTASQGTLDDILEREGQEALPDGRFLAGQSDQVAAPSTVDACNDLRRCHGPDRRDGHAFAPHAGRPTFGGASIDRRYIETSWRSWRLEGFGYVPDERHQIVVW